MAVLETEAIADPDRDCLASLQGDYYYVTIAPLPYYYYYYYYFGCGPHKNKLKISEHVRLV